MSEQSNYLIAVGLDGSSSSWKAVDEAIAQACQKKALLHIVSVQESGEPHFNATEALALEHTAREKLERGQIKAKMQAEASGLQVQCAVVAGHPVSALADYVKKKGINLLVVGDTGHSSVWGALLGTTAEKIVRDAPSSVLIVR
jgi:nucleotide-binding universal stress UspA family protein